MLFLYKVIIAGITSVINILLNKNEKASSKIVIIASVASEMKRSEKTTSIRFSQHISLKLQWLMERSKEQSIRIGVQPMNRTEIIEEAIKYYYFKIINETRDPDVIERISETVHGEVNTSLRNLHQKVDEILYLAIKNDLGNKVFYRSPSVLPSPKDKQEAIGIIVNEPSRWNDALEEYLMKKWMNEEDHTHGR